MFIKLKKPRNKTVLRVWLKVCKIHRENETGRKNIKMLWLFLDRGVTGILNFHLCVFCISQILLFYKLKVRIFRNPILLVFTNINSYKDFIAYEIHNGIPCFWNNFFNFLWWNTCSVIPISALWDCCNRNKLNTGSKNNFLGDKKNLTNNKHSSL